jgi:deazaflavin-dependent oxidoreductase (nitroreductase family)
VGHPQRDRLNQTSRLSVSRLSRVAGKSAAPDPRTIQRMNTTTSSDFVAGRPRRSGPIRAIARPFGPIANRFAGRRGFPLWGILRHTGRTSGTAYATTVVALHTPDGFLIPLPFGNATQWARNLFAAGGGSVRSGGREYRIVEPRIVDREEAGTHLPLPLRALAGRLGLRQYVMVRRVSS